MPRLKRASKAKTAVPVVRAPAINIFKLPEYRPAPAASVRTGADDHKRIQSRGVRT